VWSWLVASALAGPEEIVVYGDRFARWDETRWLVDDELLLPSPLLFGTDDNLALEAHAIRLSLVIVCHKASRQLGESWEVDCQIEDASVQAATAAHWHPSLREQAQQILTALDERLTDASIQLQADGKNGLLAVDMEGWEADNVRERQLQESVRQLLRLGMAGFHLRLPAQTPTQGKWDERHSLLLAMPSLLGSQGSSRLVHTSSPYEGLVIVQTLGEGTTTVSLGTLRPTEPVFRELLPEVTIVAAKPAGGLGPLQQLPSAPPPHLNERVKMGKGEGNLAGIELTYALTVSGVGVIDPTTGILRERVWAVRGEPTASSGDTRQTATFLHTGQLRLLGEGERPELLPTGQAAWPDYPDREPLDHEPPDREPFEGLPEWAPLRAD
jgi:hypothetical protein